MEENFQSLSHRRVFDEGTVWDLKKFQGLLIGWRWEQREKRDLTSCLPTPKSDRGVGQKNFGVYLIGREKVWDSWGRGKE
jgi:hypothetical protein